MLLGMLKLNAYAYQQIYSSGTDHATLNSELHNVLQLTGVGRLFCLVIRRNFQLLFLELRNENYVLWRMAL